MAYQVPELGYGSQPAGDHVRRPGRWLTLSLRLSRQPGRHSHRQRRAYRPVRRDLRLGRASAPSLPCFLSVILDFVEYRLHRFLHHAYDRG